MNDLRIDSFPLPSHAKKATAGMINHPKLIVFSGPVANLHSVFRDIIVSSIETNLGGEFRRDLQNSITESAVSFAVI
jgi:hypothetical protein